MKIELVQQQHIDILSLDGELGTPEAIQLEKRVMDLINSARIHIVLDMEKIRFVDSFAIKTILRLNREALGSGGSIKLLKPRNVVKKFLSIGRVLELFDCYETQVEAVKSFAREKKGVQTRPLSKLEKSGRHQREVILRLVQLLAKKGIVDVSQFMRNLDQSSKLVFQLFRNDLDK
jgi:anti-anti-sigma factor